MGDLLRVAFGGFLLRNGWLLASNHPVVDGFNRFVTPVGTTRQPADIEMSDLSRAVGVVSGIVLAFVGALYVIGGVLD